ncbi:hypothetical protein PMIN01_06529 [Paraphaeosphaeria minitans]|uniref:Uncharacterized protein n=1 Tax=Paraphaeosphaeria minitans TaxID=565426 RepID=A0A9P6GJ47_9PLEO|nr:hypothetical protein PMIN01_06529 [Paraphaeosphaeria minitans]
MKRHVSLKRTPSHVEERKIMKALERASVDRSGIHAADATAPPEVRMGADVGELEADDASDKGSESSKVAGMSLKDRRALWESTLPQKSSVLPVRPRSGHELEKLVGHIWIEDALGRINDCLFRIAFVFASGPVSWVLSSGIVSDALVALMLLLTHVYYGSGLCAYHCLLRVTRGGCEPGWRLTEPGNHR